MGPLVQSRPLSMVKSIENFKDELKSLTPITAKLAVQSTYFEVRGRLRLADRVLVERSLVQRQPNGQVSVLRRERVASLEQAGA